MVRKYGRRTGTLPMPLQPLTQQRSNKMYNTNMHRQKPHSNLLRAATGRRELILLPSCAAAAVGRSVSHAGCYVALRAWARPHRPRRRHHHHPIIKR